MSKPYESEQRKKMEARSQLLGYQSFALTYESTMMATGKYRWQAVYANGKVACRSHAIYGSGYAALRAAERFRWSAWPAVTHVKYTSRGSVNLT